MIKQTLLILLLLFSFSSASIELVEYYGDGCPHCARTTALLINELAPVYNLTIEGKEIYFNAQNRQEMFDIYIQFGLDPAKSGVPTTLVENTSLVVGEVSKERWEEVFDYCMNGTCQPGVFTESSYSPIETKDPASTLTIPVLIGAALVDSINPCTIAVMVMLLGVILMSKGKKDALWAGIAFALTVYVMYLLMGFGIFHAVTSAELTNAFYIVVTIAALVLAILEIRAYFKYRPGFFAIEMPMFLRPHTKKIMQGATSIPGVIIAAAACSFFLLPCSSGPYLLVLGMLAKSATLQAVFYLLLYNLIFILPMIVIAIAVYAGKASAEDVHELKEKYIREIHLFSGLILFALFLIMAYQLFNGI
jgi:cytochrome c biogenesis protein CcdA